MRKKKWLVLYVLIIVILFGLLLTVATTSSEDEQPNFGGELNLLYTHLRENNSNEVYKITKFPPQLNYIDIFVLPEEEKQFLLDDNTATRLERYEDFDSNVNLLVEDLNAEYDSKILGLLEQLTVYTQLTLIDTADDTLLYKFFTSNIQGDRPIYYKVIRVSSSVASKAQLLEQVQAHMIPILATTDMLTNSSWEDIENLETFQINDYKYAALYTLEDYFGYTNAAVIDIYERDDLGWRTPLRRIANLEEVPDGSISFQLRQLQQEVIKNEE